MALKVYYDDSGSYLWAETPQEAAQFVAALAQLQKEKDAGVALPGIAVTKISEEEAFAEFWKNINKSARVLLTHLLKYPQGIKADNLSDETGTSVEKIGGIFGAASKLAAKLGLAFRDNIVESVQVCEGSLRFRRLTPGPLLLKYKGLAGDVVKMPSRISVGA